MSEHRFRFDQTDGNPLQPLRLEATDQLKFRCHRAISCWNACCAHANVTLTPYDIIRLKQHTGMSSSELLKKHTVPFELDADGLPGIKLRTTDDGACLFMTDDGCAVYQNRPTACRYYPSGLLSMHSAGEDGEQQSFLLIKEAHCQGHQQDHQQTLQKFREDQGVVEYDELNREWFSIILKKRSCGPTIGKPSAMSLQLFFMASYDVDRLRRFVTSDSFKKSYQLSDDFYQQVEADDVALMQFGFKLMRQVLYGEISIAEVEGAWQKRAEQRADILKLRKQAEIKQHEQRTEDELAAAVFGNNEVNTK